jgi:hypothetical protein
MAIPEKAQLPKWPVLAWLSVLLAGLIAPAIAMLMLADATVPASATMVSGTILAVGLMGAGMIGAAVTGRFWIGVAIALIACASLIVCARGLGMTHWPSPLATGLAVIIASVSFAARGALFARSGAEKGWWIAVFVVAGEAAIVLTASIESDLWPDWLLVLLPAQWASAAFQTSLTGADLRAASSVLIALAGTAAATLLVARLWPRRWPYLVMFTTWIALSALVWHWPPPPMERDAPSSGVATLGSPQNTDAARATGTSGIS